MLVMPQTLSASMLADLTSPHGLLSNLTAAVKLSEGASRRFVAEPPDLLGYCRWDGRSGHVTTPDNLRVDFQVAPTHRMRLPEPDSCGTELPPGRLAQW
jgi:hypothetical protein